VAAAAATHLWGHVLWHGGGGVAGVPLAPAACECDGPLPAPSAPGHSMRVAASRAFESTA
jgi:hypothetical protein